MRKQRTGLKKEQFLTIVILMILWQLLAMSVNNDILIPMPLDVRGGCLRMYRSRPSTHRR